MNQMNSRVTFDMNNNRKRKNNSPKSLLIVVVVMMLLSAANDLRDSGVVLLALLVPVLGIALFFVVFKVVAKSAEKEKSKEKSSRKEDPYCKTCSDDFVYNNRQTEYKEFSAEESFVRDRQRRMKQLDDFLKNGIIDKEEYWVLRSHYEK